MSTFAVAPESISISTIDAVASEALAGLSAIPKTLSPWLFYDEAGSHLFEKITELPEYYLTRTERSIFAAHAEEILREAASSHGPHPAGKLTLIELGAGTATKTGILLAAAVRQQGSVVYQPVDVSETALAEASENILKNIPGVTVRCQVTDYTREGLPLDRLPNTRTLALYIGSSIGNFTPEDARGSCVISARSFCRATRCCWARTLAPVRTRPKRRCWPPITMPQEPPPHSI